MFIRHMARFVRLKFARSFLFRMAGSVIFFTVFGLLLFSHSSQAFQNARRSNTKFDRRGSAGDVIIKQTQMAHESAVLGSSVAKTTTYVDPLQFFNVADASLVTWAHAVNNRSLLDLALNDKTMMLEADVSLIGAVPYMAHSSEDPSDITLKDWLQIVVDNGTKGIKLDFKSPMAVAMSLPIIQQYQDQISVPLWLNADIMFNGPANISYDPGAGANITQFLELCAQFPQSALSVGWVTGCMSNETCSTAHYEWQHVKAMFDTLNSFSASTADSQVLTFPVRAMFVYRSLAQLRWLADVLTPRKTSFTIWTNIADVNYTNVEDLLRFRTFFPQDRVYYDLLDFMATEFEQKKPEFAPNSQDSYPPISLNWVHFQLKTGFAEKKSAYMGSKSVLLEPGWGVQTNTSFLSDHIMIATVSGSLQFSGTTVGDSASRVSLAVRCGNSRDRNNQAGWRLTLTEKGDIVLEEGWYQKKSEGSAEEFVGTVTFTATRNISGSITFVISDHAASNTVNFFMSNKDDGNGVDPNERISFDCPCGNRSLTDGPINLLNRFTIVFESEDDAQLDHSQTFLALDNMHFRFAFHGADTTQSTGTNAAGGYSVPRFGWGVISALLILLPVLLGLF